MNAGALCVPIDTGDGLLQPRELFGRDGPVVLDLGCGNGVFLTALAGAEPDCDFLGIERKDYRVRQARRRASGLGNVRVVHGGIEETLSRLPPSSVSRAFLLFSDPWPKRRHAIRRLVQRDFADLLRTRLEPDGEFFFASDSEDYALRARQVFHAAGWGVEGWAVAEDWPRTEFEQRFLAEGLEVSRFRASLP